MDKDTSGDSLELKLLPDGNGNIPEKEAGAAAPVEADDSDDDDEPPEMLEIHDQQWTVEKDCRAVRVDERTAPRTKSQCSTRAARTSTTSSSFSTSCCRRSGLRTS